VGPGILFGDADDVIPDVAWIGNERLSVLLDASGHLSGAPELVVEVLSPGEQNERRDRQLKRKLYSLHGVQEYWVVDWQLQQIEVYRREQAVLALAATLLGNDRLTSPLLPDFGCSVGAFFA
jgi:Uma2 family endonuclease